jgi:hypothetical protein
VLISRFCDSAFSNVIPEISDNTSSCASQPGKRRRHVSTTRTLVLHQYTQVILEYSVALGEVNSKHISI